MQKEAKRPSARRAEKMLLSQARKRARRGEEKAKGSPKLPSEMRGQTLRVKKPWVLLARDLTLR